MTYQSIIVSAYFFEEGDFWNINVQGFKNGKTFDMQKFQPDTLPSDYTEDEVIETLEEIAKSFVDDAETVSIQLEGNHLSMVKQSKDEVTIDMPEKDFDVHLKFPNGEIVTINSRPSNAEENHKGSLDIFFPRNQALTVWNYDEENDRDQTAPRVCGTPDTYMGRQIIAELPFSPDELKKVKKPIVEVEPSQELQQIRDRWETNYTEMVCSELRENGRLHTVLVVGKYYDGSEPTEQYSCFRYFTMSNSWQVSFDKNKVSAYEALEWIHEQKVDLE